MEQGFAQGHAPLFFDVPSPDRWEQLKSTILGLYLQQSVPLAQVMSIMTTQYRFYAAEHSYKYYFNLWGVTKNIPGPVKEAAILALGKRSRGGYSTPDVAYRKDEDHVIPIDKKRIKRHIKTIESKRKKEDGQIQLRSNVFMHWNLPYRAARSSSQAEKYSPFGPTPDFLSISSPSTHRTISSMNTSSPNNAPTPTMLAVRGMKLDERARLFIEAKHDDLLKQMERPERKVLTTYLYQFWLFSFETAKYWGFGPTDWTADILEFDRFRDRDRALHSSPNTPMTNAGTPGAFTTPRSDEGSGIDASLAIKPSKLCRWTIHAAIRTRYDGEDEDGSDDEDAVTGANGTERLPRWPAGHIQTFEEKLQAALDSNTFSTLDPKDLPIAVTKVAQATRSSPMQLLQESFAFCLVARNEKVFWNLLEKVSSFDFVDSGIYPLHLLTSFLDGSKTCCNLLDAALTQLAEATCIDRIYVNNHGHTVLDNLFISILKGHTNCPPDTVDDQFSKLKRFTGEEVDICGRWDADSPCIRELFAEGHSTIPIEWKHMFCHTSVQAICHCIGRLFGPVFAPDINTPSGLFLRRCQACGMKLQLRPLHALVLTACHLAQSGCTGENIFGMLACLVCLLANGADPLLKAPISLAALMRRDTATECSHEDIDPVELAERVPSSLISGWTEDATLGWNLFCKTLRYARDERRPRPKSNLFSSKGKEPDDPYELFMEPMAYETDEDGDEDEDADMSSESEAEEEEGCRHSKYETDNFYGRSKVIGTMWAAIQTELLTYRRLTEGDPWLSKNFDLQAVLDGLNNGGLLPIKLVEEDMMAPFCQCGRFDDVTDEACACVDEVCTHYFANVDVWSRASYIMIPEGKNESWYLW